MKVNYGTSSNQNGMGNALCSWEAPELVALDVEATETGPVMNDFEDSEFIESS